MTKDFTPRRTATNRIDTDFYIRTAHEIRSREAHRYLREAGRTLKRVFRQPI